MALDFIILRDELVNDPLARGYSGMTDQQAAVDLNTEYRDLWIEVTSAQIYEAVDDGEFAGKTSAEQTEVRDIWGLGGAIATAPGAKARTKLIAIFGGASATITNLQTIAKQSQSRSQELALGRSRVTESDVNHARTL